MDVTFTQWIWALVAGVLIGFNKTGIPTLGILVVALMASVFPAKESVGIVTPMLIAADLIAIVYYRRTVVWKSLFSLVPSVSVGLLLGFALLGYIEDGQLSVLLGTIVLALIVIHVFKDRLESKLQIRFTQSRVFHAILGLLAGFTTMVGNAAGGIMAIYLLSKGMRKQEFVGTGAWFFFIVNVVKVPFTAYLGLITPETLLFNAWTIPAIAAGGLLGIKTLPLIPQKHFQAIVLGLAALGGLRLLFA